MSYIEKIKKQLSEIEQIFLDAEHWNQAHPDEELINPDPDNELRKLSWRLKGKLNELKKSN